MKSIFLGSSEQIDRVYPEYVREKLRNIAQLNDKTVFTHEDILNMPPFDKTEYVFSTWGMPSFTEEEIKKHFPALRAVMYAAGTVQAFARPFLNCGIKVFSAWAANAVPVAEYTTAQIVLANKGFFADTRLYRAGEYKKAREKFSKYPGNFGCKVGLLGIGMIGSMVAEKLKDFSVEVLAYDPFLSDERAAECGVKKCSLEEIFSQCQTVSNHLANNDKTQNIITKRLLDMLPENAVFINTGRGAQISEPDLKAFLKERSDCTAVMDVTVDEPVLSGDAFYSLDNVFITTHIAGSSGNEVWRMAEYMAEEFKNFESGKPIKYEVTLEKLKTMA